jgi:hypothetical protein
MLSVSACNFISNALHRPRSGGKNENHWTTAHTTEQLALLAITVLHLLYFQLHFTNLVQLLLPAEGCPSYRHHLEGVTPLSTNFNLIGYASTNRIQKFKSDLDLTISAVYCLANETSYTTLPPKPDI